MQLSTSLIIALATYVAAEGVMTVSTSRNSSSVESTSSTKMKSQVVMPLATVVTQTVSSYITYCPSATTFAVGNISYTATTATYLTIVCPTNAPCPAIQRPSAITMALFRNNTAPLRSNPAPTSTSATCPVGVACPVAVNCPAGVNCPVAAAPVAAPCPVGATCSIGNQSSQINQVQSTSGQAQSANGAGASTNGLASAGTGLGLTSNPAGNAVGANGSGTNGASGSASGPVLSNDANKLGASIVALLVVFAITFGL